MIQAEGLSKIYQTQRGERIHALQDVDFVVSKGEFVSVVGPSGCGKSTLLKILAGLIPPSEGKVEVDGSPVTGPNRHVGVVFQDPLLLEWRTVTENVMVPIEVLKLPKHEYRQRCKTLLELTGLGPFADNYPWELSGGMQQRTAICRALVFDPKILLMDEPFGALDAMTRDYMNLELLKLWAKSKKTVILITHSINEAVFLSDRVYVMSPAPGTIRDTVKIDIERPRTLDVISSNDFGSYTRHIRRHFTEMFGSMESDHRQRSDHIENGGKRRVSG